MNWKRFFALLLVLALLPALFGNAFAAGPKARTLTDALFKLLDERAELLAALEAYPVKDGTQAVLELIEDARKTHSRSH